MRRHLRYAVVVLVLAACMPARAETSSVSCDVSGPSVTGCSKTFTLTTERVALNLEQVGIGPWLGHMEITVATATGSRYAECDLASGPSGPYGAVPSMSGCYSKVSGHFETGQTATLTMNPVAAVGEWRGEARSY